MKTPSTPNNKNIYLVRHGLATLSKWGYGRKKLTADLLPQGEIAIERIAGYLKDIPNSYNISSDLPRCKHTAEIISRITGKSFCFDKRLTEYYHETFTDLKTRVFDLLEDLSTRPEKNVIICTHGSVIAAIKHLIIENKFVRTHYLDYPKTGELAIIQNKEYREIDFN